MTLLLAPVGIPLLMLSRRLFRTAGDLVIPRKVRHPLEAIGETAASAAGDLGDAARTGGKAARKRGRKAARTVDLKAPRKMGKKVRKKARKAKRSL